MNTRTLLMGICILGLIIGFYGVSWLIRTCRTVDVDIIPALIWASVMCSALVFYLVARARRP
jgi:hypothetical protein